MYVVVGKFDKGLPIVRGPYDTQDEARQGLTDVIDFYSQDTYKDYGVFNAWYFPLEK